MESAQRPTLVINPIDDQVFAAAALRLIDEGVVDINAFEVQLRLGYPLASVHLRELTAERFTIWYVYRDGRWINAREDGGRVLHGGRDTT